MNMRPEATAGENVYWDVGPTICSTGVGRYMKKGTTEERGNDIGNNPCHIYGTILYGQKVKQSKVLLKSSQ